MSLSLHLSTNLKKIILWLKCVVEKKIDIFSNLWSSIYFIDSSLELIDLNFSKKEYLPVAATVKKDLLIAIHILVNCETEIMAPKQHKQK